MIYKTVLALAAVATLATVGASTSNAGDRYHRGHHYLHQDLEHNEFHRQQYHANRHMFPQTPYQHFRMHQQLDHDRFHDHQRHQSFHHYYRPHYRPHYRGRSGFGIGVSPYGFSLRFGR